LQLQEIVAAEEGMTVRMVKSPIEDLQRDSKCFHHRSKSMRTEGISF